MSVVRTARLYLREKLHVSEGVLKDVCNHGLNAAHDDPKVWISTPARFRRSLSLNSDSGVLESFLTAAPSQTSLTPVKRGSTFVNGAPRIQVEPPAQSDIETRKFNGSNGVALLGSEVQQPIGLFH
jgi:hypothetical protein